MFRRLAGLNWVAVVLLPLAAILMEVMWLVPWLALMGRWPIFLQQQVPLELASVLVLLGASFTITRLSSRQRWPLKLARPAIVASGLLTVLAVVRIEYSDGSGLLDPQWFAHFGRLLIGSFSRPNQLIVGILVAFYLWWRGIALGRSAFFFENIYRSFSFGLVAQVILILAWGRDPQFDFMATAGIYLAGFFFFGLSAMALSKLQSMEQKKEKEARAAFNGRWLSVIGVVTFAIIVVGIGAAGIFSAGTVSFLGRLFNLLTGVLFKIVFFATAIVAYLVAITLYIVQFIINMLVQKPPPAEPQISGNMTPIEGLKQGAARTLSPQVMQAIEWGIVILLITGVLILLAKAIMRHRRPQRDDDVEEINESLWSREGFISDLRLFFRLIWERLRGKVRQIMPQPRSADGSPAAEASDNLNVREVYQRLLWQAAQFGVTRRLQETPNEYEQRLAQTVPDGKGSLNELTELYVNVRYGDLAAGEKQVQSANGLWKVIQRLLRRTETGPT